MAMTTVLDYRFDKKSENFIEIVLGNHPPVEMGSVTGIGVMAYGRKKDYDKVRKDPNRCYYTIEWKTRRGSNLSVMVHGYYSRKRWEDAIFKAIDKR